MITLKEKLESMGKPYYDWRNDNYETMRMESDPRDYDLKSSIEMTKSSLNELQYNPKNLQFPPNNINPITGKKYPYYGLRTLQSDNDNNHGFNFKNTYLEFVSGLCNDTEDEFEFRCVINYFLKEIYKILPYFPENIIETPKQIEIIYDMYNRRFEDLQITPEKNKTRKILAPSLYKNDFDQKLYIMGIPPEIIQTKEQKETFLAYEKQFFDF